MRRFKIKHYRYRYIIPQEYKFTPEYKEAIEKINKWKQQGDLSKGLDLFGMCLKWLPVLPRNLQILSCTRNELTKLPRLPKNLQKLHCASNELTSLPPLPTSLRRLLCYNNELTSLPYLPTNLKELWCWNNKLTNLPDLENFRLWWYGKQRSISKIC